MMELNADIHSYHLLKCHIYYNGFTVLGMNMLLPLQHQPKMFKRLRFVTKRNMAAALCALFMLTLISMEIYNVTTETRRHIPESLQNSLFVLVNKSKPPIFFHKKLDEVRSRMHERKSHLRDICANLSFHHNKSNIREALIYSEKYKTIFCQIPKTGITNWKKLFTNMIGVNLTGRKFSSEFKKLYQTKRFEKDSLLRKGWFKMTVVREPMERLVSAYRSKLEGPAGSMRKIAERIQLKYGDKSDLVSKKRKAPDFNTFINYLVLNYPASLHSDNIHWGKYSSLCQPCDFDYDVIGHQETIAEDSKYILRMIGVSEELQLRPPYQNKTDDDMVLRYYSTVKPRERVMQLYNLLLDDYLLFGYPPPPLLKKLFNN